MEPGRHLGSPILLQQPALLIDRRSRTPPMFAEPLPVDPLRAAPVCLPRLAQLAARPQPTGASSLVVHRAILATGRAVWPFWPNTESVDVNLQHSLAAIEITASMMPRSGSYNVTPLACLELGTGVDLA